MDFQPQTDEAFKVDGRKHTHTLQQQKILNEFVPNNMTDYFQVLDLTGNKWVKDFMKQKFNEWFATQLKNELESGKELENILIKFHLSTLKPLHAVCLINCYNQLTLSHGKEIILDGWRASEISAGVKNGLIGFLIDPFNEFFDIDHITFVAVIELKSVWKYLSVKTCIIETS